MKTPSPQARVIEAITAAKADFAGGRRDKALRAVLALAKKHPREPLVLLEAGSIALRAGEFRKAAPLFAAAVRLRPDIANAWLCLGHALIDSRQFKTAVAALEDANARLPGNAEILDLLGQAHEKTGARAEAAECYLAAAESQPNNVDRHVATGQALNAAGRAADAIAAFERAEGTGTLPFRARTMLIGLRMQRDGFESQRQALQGTVAEMTAKLADGKYDDALIDENDLTEHVVRPVESEDHAESCLATWRDAMTAAAAVAGAALPPASRAALSSGPPIVGFFIHAASMLGHVELVLDYISSIFAFSDPLIRPHIYVLSRNDPALAVEAKRRGIPLTLVEAEWPGGGDLLPYQRLLWLRARLARDGVTALVWVTLPQFVHFGAALGLAPVNIFWALRFRPIASPFIQGYVACGGCFEREDMMNGRRWDLVPLAFADLKGPERTAEAAKIRRDLGEPRVLLGTFARAQKMQDDRWLEAVGLTLKRCPEAVFVWAGRSEDEKVRAALARMGVAAQGRHVGWVDTRLYAQAIDIFLDTAPVGCGLTAMEAMAWGKPLVSFKDPLTNWGQCLHPVLEGRIDDPAPRADIERIFKLGGGRELLAWVDTPEDYAAMVRRLMDDDVFRADVGAAGKAFTDRYFGDPSYAAARLAAVIRRVIDETAA
ncbi:MAG: tetratricopeptide repeat protein [Alphaproteobacteria bacterium]